MNLKILNEFIIKKNLIIEFLNQTQKDCVLLTESCYFYWLWNIHVSNGKILIDKNGNFFCYCDSRYTDALKLINISNLSIIPITDLNDFTSHISFFQFQKIILDSQIDVNLFLKLKTIFKDWEIKNTNIIRSVKTDEEIKIIKAAAQINEIIMRKLFDYVIPGKTEKEIAKHIKKLIIQHEADNFAFEPIVASGPNGAYPHHQSSNRIVQAHELITVDFGIVLKGYNSDMTRTWAVANTEISWELIQLHSIVKQAHWLAIHECLIDKSISNAENAVHKYFELNNCLKYFAHSTGHGLGIKVHEYPVVSYKNKAKWLKNMVSTIEPGLYINGFAGVRIEDTIIINSQGQFPTILNKNLTRNHYY